MIALGSAGATPKRKSGLRLSFLVLGVFSTVAALVLIYRAGGFPALAFVGSGLTVLIGAGVVIWYFVGLIASVDEALMPREPPPPTDFTILNQPRENRDSAAPIRRSLAERMGLKTARDRIAKMGWMFRKPRE
jgi:hypothetical protein